jgi:peptide/nickel transport system permease protein
VTSGRRRAVLALLIAAAAVAAAASVSHDPARQFPDAAYAPPMPPHVIDGGGQWHLPFVYPLRLVDRLERRYVEDRSRPLPLQWFSGGRLVSIDDAAGPWLPLGGDSLGRDILARIVQGARTSLGVALAAALGALCLGVTIGSIAGYCGGRLDELLMRVADVVVVLPAIYVVLALRSAMPLVLSPRQVFWTVALVLAAAGWPYPARGVRAIIAAERRKEYAESARALGAGSVRILLRHLLPATGGFIAVQATLLLPAFILAEATLSFVGLGFSEPTASWGLMLQDAARGGALVEAPWLLAPAGAIVLAVLALHGFAGRGPGLRVLSRSSS